MWRWFERMGDKRITKHIDANVDGRVFQTSLKKAGVSESIDLCLDRARWCSAISATPPSGQGRELYVLQNHSHHFF